MAMVTTINNEEYYFDPTNVAAISDHDPSSGAAVTCICGISTAYLPITEAPQAFMARVGIAAKLFQLTTPNGPAIWVNGSSVVSIRSRIASDGPTVNALLSFSSMPIQAVRENANVVAAALKLS